jgi:hypothetical protein
MRAGLLLIVALALAACGTTERHGKVGDALKGDHMQAKLLAFVATVPERRLGHDVTGLNAPARGMRFAAADVAVCNDTGAAAIPWRFELRLGDGSSVHPQQPVSVYDNELETVRDGCDDGWVVWQVPAAAKAESVYYEFDHSEQIGQPGSGSVREEHDRFHWSL